MCLKIRNLVGLISAVSLIGIGSATYAEGSKQDMGKIKGVTAITEVFGDGQKVSAVAVEYGVPIANAKLKITDFSVDGKTVTRVYANTIAEKATRGVNGNFVIVELDTTLVPSPGIGNRAGNDGQIQKEPADFHGPTLGEKSDKPATPKILSALVTQRADIAGSSGEIVKAPVQPVKSDKTVNLVVQDFKQLVYKDPSYGGESLMYNLFVPKNYDPSKKYPLVLFIHDAGVSSNNPIETLTQGLGAIVWATPENQAKHESFVLAPQFTRVIADDNSDTTEDMDITVDLVKSLLAQYSIDPDRLYSTGQSMGGMISIAMNSKYPDLFAASLYVACQWDVAKINAPMVAKKPLWIIVSEGDEKACPGQNAITQTLQKQGATVTQASWSATANAQERDKEVRDMLAAGTSINYAVFKGGNHPYTWQYAYGIDGVRDWLLNQKK